ncbi:hypothetical protein SAMN05444159_3626 [Bradyrhizobium lablabi]|uniref:Uncharacterized protein n=1 Tax=Bradyrhizobium lablabi TaxID=722472 RepID=A0A1M6TLA6_9BRAD|nr:hypothetical protein [Bradyrhizobium lablabi]SHK57724.1 hypothetical protein SAMN05444159_3626 [Bradyrhizobium lablabi]
MDRIWKIPLFVLATAYFVVDGLFSYVTRPISAWLGKMHFFERARRWIVSLRPYPSLALFAVPVILLEPVKPLAGYLVATGHLLSGAATFLVGEVLKLTCVERLFQLNRQKLLSIPAFAAAYGYWRRMMDAIESMEIWKASRRLVSNAGHILRRRWLQFKRAKASSRLQFRSPR